MGIIEMYMLSKASGVQILYAIPKGLLGCENAVVSSLHPIISNPAD